MFREDSPILPPRDICIAGALAITAGLNAVIGMVIGAIGGGFSLDFGFVGIPIGYGLLMGRASSRVWALFFAFAGCLITLGVGGWGVFNHVNGSDPLYYPDGVYVAVELVVTLLCSVYVAVVLTRKSNRAGFDSVIEPSSAPRSLAWAVAFAAGVFSILDHASGWWVEETHAKIFPIRVMVIPYNSQNDEGVNNIGYHSDAIHRSSRPRPHIPKVTVTTIGGRDGMQLEFSGVATRPVEVTLESDGLQDTVITLHQKMDREIRVGMVPIETNAPEQRAGGQRTTRVE